MKKWLAIVLALVVLVGSVVPCCPLDDCADEISYAVSNETPVEDDGNCSPFSACASCTGFVQLAKAVALLQPSAEPPVHHEFYLPLFPSSYSPSLFQPPRLS